MNRDQLTKKVEQSCIEILDNLGYISSVEVLLKLEYLTKDNYEKWRFGKTDYLEKVCTANLNKLNFINSSISKLAKKLNLRSSRTVYMKHGKCPKTRLKFSKSNSKAKEIQYSTHYLNQK